MSRTLRLIEGYMKVLKEDAGNPEMAEMGSALPPEGGGDVTENPAPDASQDQMPMTSEGENEYIANLIDAALFSPSPEDAKTLNDLQGAMKLKRYTNAREEILPIVLGIIQPSTSGGDLKSSLVKNFN